MSLKAVMEKLDDIPEPLREYYKERDGKFELNGIEGVKTVADVERLTTALEKERADHKEAKGKLKVWEGLDHDDVVAKLDKYPELETLAAGKGGDEEKVKKLVDARLAQEKAPLERELKQLRDQVGTLEGTNKVLTAEGHKRAIHDSVREAVQKAKLDDLAMPDILLNAENMLEVQDGKVVVRDNVGVTPGVDPSTWLGEMLPKRPLWNPETRGGGAGGGRPGAGGGKNPWSEAGWNLTAQGAFIREHGMEKAEQMAKAAGSHIGATEPPRKK